MSEWLLFFVFFKFGLLCFGGGYMLVPLLTADIVEKYKALTPEQFVNLVSIAQVTPGPIGINCATYTGYLQHGIIGAAIATFALTLPSFLLVLLLIKMLKKWSHHWFLEGFLSGMRPAAVGMVVVAMFVFAELSVFTGKIPVHGGFAGFSVRWGALAVMAVTLFIQLKFKLKITYLILVSAVLGAILCN